jgi:hypothetical protein
MLSKLMFHSMEKFVSMIDYDPAIAREDKSEVFREVCSERSPCYRFALQELMCFLGSSKLVTIYFSSMRKRPALERRDAV